MSEATNKEFGFSSEQHLQVLRCLYPKDFIPQRLIALT